MKFSRFSDDSDTRGTATAKKIMRPTRPALKGTVLSLKTSHPQINIALFV